MEKQTTITHATIEAITIDIVDKIDYFLEEKGIIVPDDDRQATTIEEANELGEAMLYGCSYGTLKSEIYDVLSFFLLDDCEIDEFGGYHDEGLGWNPDGKYCGECSNITCVGCPASNRPLAIRIIL